MRPRHFSPAAEMRIARRAAPPAATACAAAEIPRFAPPDQFGIVIGTDQRRGDRRESAICTNGAATRCRRRHRRDDSRRGRCRHRIDRTTSQASALLRAFSTADAPLSEQRLHPIEDRTVVVDAQNAHALQIRPDPGRAQPPVDAARAPRTDFARHAHPEHRAAAGMAGERQGMLHELCEPIANRQAESQTLLTPRRVMFEPAELGVHRLALMQPLCRDRCHTRQSRVRRRAACNRPARRHVPCSAAIG
jgi:hypothetical protein